MRKSSVMAGLHAWAVGPGIIIHWDGASWKKVSAPVSNDYLNSVTAISPVDVWVVGHAGLIHATQPVAWHWDGTTWTSTSLPSAPKGTLGSVAASGSGDVWSVGSYGTNDGRLKGSKTLAVHWTGSAWERSPAPSPSPGAALNGISVRRDDVWAVGGKGSSTIVPFSLHWNGRSWKTVRVPIVAADESLSSVSARSTRDVWTVGSAYPKTLTMHWNGRRWKVVKAPSPGGPGTGALLSAVNTASKGQVWAVGDYGTRSGGLVGLFLRWNGRVWIGA